MLPLLAMCILGSHTDIALQHRNQFPRNEWGYIYYLSLDSANIEIWEPALRFAVAGSSSQEIIEYCTPKPIKVTVRNAQEELITQIVPGLYWIDLRELKWDWKQWHTVLKSYPYKTRYDQAYPLVIKGEWLAINLLDTTKNDAHYRLLYGREKFTRNDFLAFWKGTNDKEIWYGIPEDSSKVSVQKKRWLLNVGTQLRTYLWRTFDFLKIDRNTNPLGNLLYVLEQSDKQPVHDGEELIAGMPKFSLEKKEFGTLQAYLLSDGKGNRVEEAPGSLVKSDGSFREYTAITNNGGCLNCHKQGLIASSVNALADYQTLRRAGLEGVPENPYDYPYAAALEKNKALTIDKFNLHSPTFDITQAQTLYNTGCQLVTGLTSVKCTSTVLQAVRLYDAPVTVEIAARELYTTVEELNLALPYYNATTTEFIPPEYVQLAQGKPIARSLFEGIYTQCNLALLKWREDTKPKLRENQSTLPNLKQIREKPQKSNNNAQILIPA